MTPYQLDVEIFRSINSGWHRAWLDPVFLAFTWLGDGFVESTLVLLGLFVPTGRRAFWALASSLVVGGLICVHLLKHLIPRLRPSNLPGAIVEEPLYYNSFPSGHTASAFGLAVCLTLLTRGTRQAWTGWLALALALGVGASRIYRGVHYPSDVLAGACLGTLVGCLAALALGRGRLSR